MSPRIPALLLLGALTGLAQAGIWETGNPPGLKGRGALAGIRVQGLAVGIKLTGRHGREVVVRLPRPISLSEPIQLPAGDWADITLTLDGPVTVWVPGASPVMLEVDSITVPLEDPEAREVLLDWTLPEGTTTALRAGIGVPDLASALEDGALAR